MAIETKSRTIHISPRMAEQVAAAFTEDFPRLSVAQVVADTANGYTVQLRIADSTVGYYITSSGSSRVDLGIYTGVIKNDFSPINRSSTYFTVSEVNPDVTLHTSIIDGTVFHAVMQNKTISQYIGIFCGTLQSQYDGKGYLFCSISPMPHGGILSADTAAGYSEFRLCGMSPDMANGFLATPREDNAVLLAPTFPVDVSRFLGAPLYAGKRQMVVTKYGGHAPNLYSVCMMGGKPYFILSSDYALELT